MISRDWRDDSTVKRTHWCSRGPRFSSQHPHDWELNPPTTISTSSFRGSVILWPLQVPGTYMHTCGAYIPTCRQNTCPNKTTILKRCSLCYRINREASSGPLPSKMPTLEKKKKIMAQGISIPASHVKANKPDAISGTMWCERADSSMLFSNLHICTTTCAHMYTHREG